MPHIASLYPYMSAQAQDPCRSQESQYNRKQRILYPVIHCTASRIRPLNRVIWQAVFCGQLLDIQQVNDRDPPSQVSFHQTALICHRHGASWVQNSLPQSDPAFSHTHGGHISSHRYKALDGALALIDLLSLFQIIQKLRFLKDHKHCLL